MPLRPGWRLWLAGAASGLLVITAPWANEPPSGDSPGEPPADLRFDGQRAWRDVARAVAFGPRLVGSPEAAAARAWMVDTLRAQGFELGEQVFSTGTGARGTNLVAWRGEGPVLLVGGHYDTRPVAERDRDPARRARPGPGANDGGSSVAVLLELARALQGQVLAGRLCLVLFDAEDGGGAAGGAWIEGSRHFVASARPGDPCWPPASVLIVDMVGRPGLRLLREASSTPALVTALWAFAAGQGVGETFLPDRRGPVIDDHRPFLDAGIPAALLIDLDDPNWHTHADRPEAVDPASLAVVGRVLEAWIRSGRGFGAP